MFSAELLKFQPQHKTALLTTGNDDDYNDLYQGVNDFELDANPSQYSAYNTYETPIQRVTSSKKLPQTKPYQVYPFEQLHSIPSPRLLPEPLANTIGNYEDVVMSRTAHSRRPIPLNAGLQRNSPIYYVRLPPTPYMFYPGLSIPPPSSNRNLGSGYSTFLPVQSVSPLPSLSTVFNIPVTFLANGKPSGIYQMGGSPNDFQNSPTFSNTVASPPLSLVNPFRPNQLNNNYGDQSYIPNVSTDDVHDSKMTLLKKPLLFNGRPDGIFILPNNFNSVFNDNSFY